MLFNQLRDVVQARCDRKRQEAETEQDADVAKEGHDEHRGAAGAGQGNFWECMLDLARSRSSLRMMARSAFLLENEPDTRQ